jgi:hypothetical protein
MINKNKKQKYGHKYKTGQGVLLRAPCTSYFIVHSDPKMHCLAALRVSSHILQHPTYIDCTTDHFYLSTNTHLDVPTAT